TNAPVTTPDLPTVPPPPAVVEPPPPPPPARVVGTTVPTAYYNSLEAIIQKSVQYPKKSLENQEEGNCMVRVTFGRDGSIENAQLVQKAGYAALDSECRNVFSRIGKFPAIPENANPDATDFAIELPINFALQ
ncbi:MAG: energy transducer TonB, partial [Nevskia sp.]|nr:energy transducer TonB [Nevskia sp.]